MTGSEHWGAGMRAPISPPKRPRLELAYNDEGCAVRVTFKPPDHNGRECEPVSGGGHDLPTALRNLAWVIEQQDIAPVWARSARGIREQKVPDE